MNVLYEFGGYSPIILLILSWYLLWDHKNMFFYFNVGLFLNTILNVILKGLIQEPRPLFDNKKIKLMSTRAKDYFFQNGVPFDIYGMPSGHAQFAFYTTTFVYLVLKHTNTLYLYLLFSLLICYQRVFINYHTIQQLIIGAIVGSIFAYIVFYFSREKIKGRIRERVDDYGPT